VIKWNDATFLTVPVFTSGSLQPETKFHRSKCSITLKKFKMVIYALVYLFIYLITGLFYDV
jgi:hypothetical protein